VIGNFQHLAAAFFEHAMPDALLPQIP